MAEGKVENKLWVYKAHQYLKCSLEDKDDQSGQHFPIQDDNKAIRIWLENMHESLLPVQKSND